MTIIGYLDRLSFRPGDDVHARFSTTARDFSAGLVRIYLGDTHPLGPGPDIRPVATRVDGRRFPGRVQPLHRGSHIRTAPAPLPTSGVVALHTAIRPTLPRAGHRQAVLTLAQHGRSVVALAVDTDGVLTITGDGVPAPLCAVADRWYRVRLHLDLVAGRAEVTATSRAGDHARAEVGIAPDHAAAVTFTFAADAATPAGDHFNGRIDAPELFAVPAGDGPHRLAAWDFGPSDGALRVVANREGETWSARCVNFPLRACLGIAGAADDVDPRLAPHAYSAVHFHDDDLDDAGWDEDFVLALPADLPSGVYGVQVEASDGTSDVVPFVVVPAPARRADVLLVLPTLSYLAYSCEHVMADPGARAYLEDVGVDEVPAFGGNRHDEYLVREGLRSLYDVHTDLSGVCFTSARKPLPNLRPDHRWAAVAGGATSAHQFSADLHLVAWLAGQGVVHDVVTDEEIHRDGLDALTPYRVVLTGSHPEYPTTRMLHAYQDYVDGGGRLMYMGGNGFYWVTGIDPEEGHTVEIRRTAGIRAWEPDPGEWHLATTGELGGLWRQRGHPPQSWLGVGMIAQGFDGNRPYEVGAGPENPRAAFAWEGVDVASGLIGDFPSMVNGPGAAGVEIDHVDPALGTPPGTVVLATARHFTRAYGIDPVEVRLPDGRYDGSTHEGVTCDLVLVPAPNEGAVFSTGSIAWCGSLLVDGADNPVSRLTRNVLEAFRTRKELPFRTG